MRLASIGRLCFILCFSQALLLSGCGGIKDTEPTVAVVNGQPIYLKDFQRELSIKVRQDPSLKIDNNTLLDLADTMIKRQIIIQEAMKKNMAEEARFRDTIKAFWEQTLIRDFIDYKNREFEEYIFVTDGETKDYYSRLKAKDADIPPLGDVYSEVKEMVRYEKRRQALESWLREKQKTAKIEINKRAIAEELKK